MTGRLAALFAASWSLMSHCVGEELIADIQQGTNMALAIAPDRETLVVDLLGQLWELPITGGAAAPANAPDDSARARSREAAAQLPSGPAAVGHRLAHYEVIALVGAGGMGEVYRARDLTLGREVAIKVMHRGFSSNPDRARRFEREARAAAALNHPSIATIFGFEDAGGTPFIVLEYLEGQTLDERLSGGVLGVEEALQMGIQVARAQTALRQEQDTVVNPPNHESPVGAVPNSGEQKNCAQVA